MSDEHQPWRGGQWQQFWPEEPVDLRPRSPGQPQQEQQDGPGNDGGGGPGDDGR